jgi:hypothetical protein
MLLLRRVFAVVAIACGLFALSRASGMAAEFKLPPLTGELSGKFTLFELPGAPVVQWKLRIEGGPDGARHGDVELVGPGTQVHAKLDLTSSNGSGKWEIVESRLDAATWFAFLSPSFQSATQDLKVTGRFNLSGSGSVKDGKLLGAAQLTWSDGSVSNAVQGWRLDGISLKGDIAADSRTGTVLKSNRPWQLTVGTISTTRFGARNLAISAVLNEDRTIFLQSAKVELAGGDVTIDPTSIELSPGALDLTIHANRIGLQDLVALVPASLADAQGRIDGSVNVSWSEAAGLRIGEGGFVLRQDEVATLRLVARPGFLTGGVPERISLLPKWSGPIGTAIAPKNPVYGDVHAIELGVTQLQIKSFSLQARPWGDERKRTAVIQVSARPYKEGGPVKLVTFDINVDGPLSALLRAGMSDDSTFDVH